MLWMESYLFCCSVRLGVIIVGALTFLQVFIPAIVLLAMGIEVLDPIVYLFEHDDQYGKNSIVIKFAAWIKDAPENFMVVMNTYYFMHMAACALAIYGALKLHKWFLVPLIILEFLRVIYCLMWHIVLMIMLKKILNLGVLIAFTLLGGFIILYLGYNWATCVALFQIINLINTKRYKLLYGDDPFKPLIVAGESDSHYGNQFGYGTVDNVRVLVTPNANEIDEQKRKNAMKTPPITKPPQIIAVLPVVYYADRKPIVERNKKWANRWRQQPLPPPVAVEPQYQQQLSVTKLDQNDYTGAYANWQWAELMGAPKKPNWQWN